LRLAAAGWDRISSHDTTLHHADAAFATNTAPSTLNRSAS